MIFTEVSFATWCRIIGLIHLLLGVVMLLGRGKAADAFNLSGFSVGLGIHAKKFDLAFSRNGYHLSQAANYINISFRL